MTYLLAFIVIYPTWLLAGQIQPFQTPMIFFPLLALPFFDWDRVKHDVVFWCGVVFLALLVIRIGCTDLQTETVGSQIMLKTSVRLWHMPLAVRVQDCVECLAWFVPFFVLLVAVRFGRRIDYEKLLRLACINGVLIAFYAVFQYCEGNGKIYWCVSMVSRPVGPFGYENNAATFFILVMCLCLHLKAWYLLPVPLLALVYTESIAGYVMAGVVLAAPVLRWSMREATKDERYFTIGALTFAAGYFMYLARHFIAFNFVARFWYVDGLLRTFRTFPIFGVGPWGFRWFTIAMMPEAFLARLRCTPIIHCDPLLFLVEYGVVGLSLLAIPVAFLFAQSKRGPPYLRLGCWLVLMHSLVDMPLRCPAVLLLFAVLLCSFARLTNHY